MPSVKRLCLLALILAGTGAGVRSDVQAVNANADERDAVRSHGQLCTSADTTAACLFKGLLKGVLLYTTRRHVAPAVAPAEKDGQAVTGAGGALQPQSKGIEEYLFEQIQNVLGLFSFGFDLPAEITTPWSLLKSSFLDGRGKKNKNLGPMLAAGVAVMAGTMMPLAFGALFMMAGKAIMTSLLAITIAAMLGLKELMAGKHGHYKAYTSASVPHAHYSEAQFEQELGVYKGQTEAKMHNAAGNYYAGDSSLSAYYKGSSEQQVNGSDEQPEYYAVGGTSPKFHRHGDAVDNSVVSSHNNNVVVNGNTNNNNNNNNNGNKILTDRVG